MDRLVYVGAKLIGGRFQNVLHPYAIFSVARCFLEAAKLLRAESVRHPKLVFPEIMMSAVSAELFLKCFHFMRFKKQMRAKGHGLRSMFDRIPPDDIALIERLFKNEVAQNPLCNVLVATCKLSLELHTTLHRLDKVFSSTRYRFEGDSFKTAEEDGTAGLAELVGALRAAIIYYKPDWERKFASAFEQFGPALRTVDVALHSPGARDGESHVESYEIYADSRTFMAASFLTSTGGSTSLILPSQALAAFALELLIKCLLYIRDGEYPSGADGHEIQTLFSLLSTVDKNQIDVYFREIVEADPICAVFREEDGVDYSIEKEVRYANKLYVRLRYGYKGEPLVEIDGIARTPEFTAIYNAIHKVIYQVEPKFAARYGPFGVMRKLDLSDDAARFRQEYLRLKHT